MLFRSHVEFGKSVTSTWDIVKGVVAGNVITKGIEGIAGAFVDLGKETLNSYMYTEKLTAGLQGYIATRMQTGNAGLGVPEAMQLAAPRAAEVARFATNVTLRSPYTREEGAGLLQTSMQTGQTSTQAQQLTKDVVTFGEATGKSAQQLNASIALMGNLRTAGRASYAEINNIAQMGIPIWEQLSRSMGMSVQELQRWSLTGMPAEQVLSAMQAAMRGTAQAAEKQNDSFGVQPSHPGP